MEITELLKKRTEIKERIKALESDIEEVEKSIKAFMKERLWDNYNDESTGISVRISSEQRESWDKTALRMFLSKEEYEKACVIKTFEKMSIMTPKDKERMNMFAKNITKKKKVLK